MGPHRHHVSGFFATSDEAQEARSSLLHRGLSQDQVRIHETRVALDSLADVALTATDVSLFVACAMKASLVNLGWGGPMAVLKGTTVAGQHAATAKRAYLSSLVGDAIEQGQIVLVADTRTPGQTAMAREVIQVSIGDYQDLALG